MHAAHNLKDTMLYVAKHDGLYIIGASALSCAGILCALNIPNIGAVICGSTHAQIGMTMAYSMGDRFGFKEHELVAIYEKRLKQLR